MPAVTMKQLLESGVHFGHQTRRWNPKMRRYIFGERAGIYIIDLQQTLELLDQACDVVRDIGARGGTVLFVGTKKQCQEAVTQSARRCGMPFVANRWLGGLLTNWGTMSERTRRMHALRKQKAEGQLDLLPTRERLARQAELEKLEINLGGVADMERLPHAIVIVDLKKEAIAVKEANRLGIPVIGLVDTNCDPDDATYVIPGNDDAIRSCGLIVGAIATAVLDGRGLPPEGAPAPVDEAPADAGAPDAAQAEEAPAPAPVAEAGLPVTEGTAAVTEPDLVAEAPASPAEERRADPPVADEVPAAPAVEEAVAVAGPEAVDEAPLPPAEETPDSPEEEAPPAPPPGPATEAADAAGGGAPEEQQ